MVGLKSRMEGKEKNFIEFEERIEIMQSGHLGGTVS